MHVASLVLLLGLFGGHVNHRTITENFMPSGAATLVVKAPNADIDLTPVDVRPQAPLHVAAGDGTIHVQGDLASRSIDTLNGVTLTGARSGSEYVISENFTRWNRGFTSRYHILYPASMRVRVELNAGDVDVHHPAQEVSVTSSSGDVTIDAPQRPVRIIISSGNAKITLAQSTLSVQTSSGDVDASIAPGWSGKSIDLWSSSGNVSLQVPSAFGGVLHAGSSSGSVRNIAGLPTKGAGTPIDVHTSSGDVVVK